MRFPFNSFTDAFYIIYLIYLYSLFEKCFLGPRGPEGNFFGTAVGHCTKLATMYSALRIRISLLPNKFNMQGIKLIKLAVIHPFYIFFIQLLPGSLLRYMFFFYLTDLAEMKAAFPDEVHVVNSTLWLPHVDPKIEPTFNFPRCSILSTSPACSGCCWPCSVVLKALVKAYKLSELHQCNASKLYCAACVHFLVVIVSLLHLLSASALQWGVVSSGPVRLSPYLPS